jgi:bifunctional DNA-binding transcriptional regulator/antitoxin component of YhaV-PrlF toxin-antitoxin module
MQDTPNRDINLEQGTDSLLVSVNIDKQGRIVIPKVIRDRHKGSLDGGQQLYLIDRGEKLELYLDFRKLPLSEF